jgi:hypothetical protein
MNAAIEFRNVDILFSARGKRRGPAMQQALAALDAGATRARFPNAPASSSAWPMPACAWRAARSAY